MSPAHVSIFRRRFASRLGLLSLAGVTGCAGVAAPQAGQTVGTIAGAAIAPGVGAPLGALVGYLAGMMVQGEVDKSTEKKERRELSDRLGARTETASLPIRGGLPASAGATRVWVDETVQDGRLVEGHYEAR